MLSIPGAKLGLETTSLAGRLPAGMLLLMFATRSLVFILLLAGAATPYNLYYANLHSHTSYSDGQRFPRDAYLYARDTAHIQVLAVTDHCFMLDYAEFVSTLAQADSATESGRFVALRGFEWSSQVDGHMNIFETDTFVSREDIPGMTQFFPWLYTQPNAIGQFNHPGSGDFDDFHYTARADTEMMLCEMKTMPQSRRFSMALDSGWHVGASAGQDNQEADWGAQRNLTGIWADSLTRNSILAAIRAMRTYGTMNRNTELEFTANGAWMGSTISNGSLHFHIRASDPDPADLIQRVELVTNSGTVTQSLTVGNSTSVDWSPSLSTSSGERRYFFARVVFTDSIWTVSSPIWTAGAAGLEEASATSPGPSFVISPNPVRAGKPACLRFSAADTGSATLFDAVGRAVWSPGALSPTLLIPPLPAGVYVLRWFEDGHTVSQKLVVR
jgi:hypothetical protein